MGGGCEKSSTLIIFKHDKDTADWYEGEIETPKEQQQKDEDCLA